MCESHDGKQSDVWETEERPRRRKMQVQREEATEERFITEKQRSRSRDQKDMERQKYPLQEAERKGKARTLSPERTEATSK